MSKVATKKNAKKVAAAKAPREKKEGLKKNQIRVLECLAKKDGLTRAAIAEKTGIDVASLTGYIGPVDPDKRKYNDETYFKTLVTYGYVKHEEDEAVGIVHRITAAGRKALTAAKS